MKIILITIMLLLGGAGCLGPTTDFKPVKFEEKEIKKEEPNIEEPKEKLLTCYEVAVKDFGWRMDYFTEDINSLYVSEDLITDKNLDKDGNFNLIECEAYQYKDYRRCYCKLFKLTIKTTPSYNPTPNTFEPEEQDVDYKLKDEKNFNTKISTEDLKE